MIFILIQVSKDKMGIKNKCTLCGDTITIPFNPMREWSLEGQLCGKCYSKKIDEYYPGGHVRVNKE